MFRFKWCPRCSGDLYCDHDQYGRYITCAQCGFSKDLPENSDERIIITADPIPAPVLTQSKGDKRRRLSHGGRRFARTIALAKRSSPKIAA